MKFSNLENILDTNNLLLEANLEKKLKSGFSKVLKMLSSFGMDYDDKIIKNIKAIPANQNLVPKDSEMELEMQNLFGTLRNWDSKDNEDKSFYEKDLVFKQDVLHKMAQLNELEDILDMMSNEAIVYDDNFSYICKPYIDTTVLQLLNKHSQQEIQNAVESIFYKIYVMADFKYNAWHLFKRYLIDGILAWEIVYDDIEFPKSIIGMVPLDPVTLSKEIENGVTIWYQFKDVMGKERKFLDAQIVYIKYEDTGVETRLSYLERLIRPFNMYRIIEQAQIIWTVTQSSFKTMFTIPVAGMNRAKGMQTLNSTMARYKEDISFNIESGELKVNGKTNMPFNKEYWLPEGTNGTPQIETLVDQGPTISDNEQLKYFKNELYKMSKIPLNRFDNEAQTGWFGTDATQVLREEINFSRFVARLQHAFSQIIIKPLQIQLALQVPDIKNDKRILNAISLKYNSYNQFEEMMNIDLMQKRVEFIQTMTDGIVSQDEEGNDVPFFCSKFLVERYLNMSSADLELNEKYKQEAIDAKKKEEGGDEEGGDEGDDDGGSEDLGSEESSAPSEGGSSDVTADMLGDVSDEGSDTTQA